MIPWLLAASVSLVSSDIDVGLELHEQTEPIIWLIVATV